MSGTLLEARRAGASPLGKKPALKSDSAAWFWSSFKVNSSLLIGWGKRLLHRPNKPSIACLLGVLLSCGCQPSAPRTETESAHRFLDSLAAGKFSAASQQFDARMSGALPPEKLHELWEMLGARAGRFQGQRGSRTTEEAGYKVVFVTCQFERALVDAKIVFDPQKRISGLFFGPANQTEVPFASAPYVRPEAFTEREVIVGEEKWKLPGTLSLPTGGRPFPGLVLVHGSGPCDRDETVLANKPFRDLAGGLASKGIAVLRYEKRTRAQPEACAALADHFTVQEETIDDALAALAFLRRTPGIDTNRLFVLGHSLGGMLLPRLGQVDGRLAGLIIAAAPADNDVPGRMLEQVTYVAGLNPVITPEEQKQIEELNAGVVRIKALSSTDVDSATPILGAPPRYWLDLRAYQPLEAAKSVGCRLLILHGGRDYQVTLNDFEKWRETLGSFTNVTCKIYPLVNHLFLPGEGKSTPDEYARPGHVDKEVIKDISNWISLSPRGG